MLSNIFRILAVVLLLFVINDNIRSVRTANIKTAKCRVDTVIVTDTLYDTIFIDEKTKYFQCFDDVILFTAYLKTQSDQLDDDNWSVIHTLFNRLDDNRVTWREYFNTPSINHSNTIKKMINGSLNSYVDLSSNKDRRLIARVLDAYWCYNPTECPKNVLYFESYKHSPNNGVFLKSKIWKEYRHKFYFKNDYY